jgi:hypothetical protein
MGQENYQITGDLPGATSRFVERHYSGKEEGTPRGMPAPSYNFDPKIR